MYFNEFSFSEIIRVYISVSYTQISTLNKLFFAYKMECCTKLEERAIVVGGFFALVRSFWGLSSFSQRACTIQVRMPLLAMSRTTTEEFENAVSEIAEGSADCRSSIR